MLVSAPAGSILSPCLEVAHGQEDLVAGLQDHRRRGRSRRGALAVAFVNRSVAPPATDLQKVQSPPINVNVTQIQNQYPNPDNSSTEYIALLESRAAKILAQFREDHDSRLDKFADLHSQNIKALRNNQQIVSHELNNEIQALLGDSDIVPKVPGVDKPRRPLNEPEPARRASSPVKSERPSR